VGVAATRSVRAENGRRQVVVTGRIEDLGDLRVYGALEEIDATGLTLAPAFEPAAKAGDEVALPDWSASRSPTTISVGQFAHFYLLRPATAPGRYVVERVIRVGER
jgi:hypothetical protein